VIDEAQARLAEGRQWALNEKGLVGRADLGAADDVIASLGSASDRLVEAVDAVAALVFPPV
jgi:hypothetical protein